MHRVLGNTKLARRLIFAGGIGIVLCTALLGMLAVLPAVSPSTGATVADWIRGIVGPRPVAVLEGESLAMQDAWNRFMAAYDGGRVTISLAQTAPGQAAPSTTSGLAGPGGVKSAIGLPAGDNVVSAPPQIGWIPFGPAVNGFAVMAQTLVNMDPQRSYAGIALVRMDLSQLQLHMMPGSQEPSHAPSVVNALPEMGLTPASDQTHLIAGFNGGFKAVNGQYGMMVNGVTLLPPTPGLATLAIYHDGHVAIGAWGTQITANPDIVAFRQNCPPIIQNGSINPQVYQDNRSVWGNTVGNREITWRTAVGISQDGRYLIYAVGNGTTVQTLAQALLKAGAYNAMQLDINRPFAHFVTYQATGSTAAPLRAVPLLNQMETDPKLYLVTHARDYFYLTSR